MSDHAPLIGILQLEPAADDLDVTNMPTFLTQNEIRKRQSQIDIQIHLEDPKTWGLQRFNRDALHPAMNEPIFNEVFPLSDQLSDKVKWKI